MTPTLEINDLTTEIKLRHAVVHAVDGLSLSIQPGETLGVVGESGSGKSITGLSVMRLLPHGGNIVSGSVKLNGQELTGLSETEMRRYRGNEIGMIFQDPMTSLNPTMTIGRQVGEPLRIHKGASKAEALARAEEVLGLVGMPRPKERLSDYPHQLSGGMRQRAMIAMALALEPKLLIADEPTTALDVTIQAQILSLLDDLKQRLSMSILLITHDMGVIAGRAERVMVMYAGRIVESARTEDLFGHTHHPYSEALMGSIPALDHDPSELLLSIPGLPPDLTNPPSGCHFHPRCSYATSICSEPDPPLSGDDPMHPYACFHPVGFGPELGPALSGPPRQRPAAGEGPAEGGGGGVVTLARRRAAPAAAPGHEGGGATTPALLELRDLVKEYPVTAGAVLQRKVGSVKAVSGVSVGLAQGETLGIVGESGCGKSTIGRLVVAIEKPTSGAVLFDGQDITKLSGPDLRRKRRDLQLMFQDPYTSLNPRMRVGTIVREPLAIQHMGSKKAQQDKVSELLREVGLNPKAQELYPHEFSGGQRQRIGLARALTLNPRLIVADEPVSALDVSIRSQILNLMRSLQDRHNLTYVFISHDLSVVRYMSDKIAVMYLGKLVELAASGDLYLRPAHPYTRGLIDTIPEPDPARERTKNRAAIKGELPSAIHPPSGCRFRTRCPLAQEICAEVEPPLRPFGEGHTAACHFPLEQPTGGAV
ncbi:MAG: ABC transporter ATP-binding protein [Acidimicrobiales bacterium]